MCSILRQLIAITFIVIPIFISADEHHKEDDVVIKSHIAPHTDFSHFKSFCLHLMDDIKSRHLFRIHPELEKWIAEDLSKQLSQKGFRQVANHQCDLEFGYEVRIRNQAMLHAARYQHSGITAVDNIELIPERTIIIHGHDLHMDRTIWIGSAEEAIFDNARVIQKPEAVQARIESSLQKMFEIIPEHKNI